MLMLELELDFWVMQNYLVDRHFDGMVEWSNMEIDLGE